MAITITSPTNANLADNGGSRTVIVSGLTSGNRVTATIDIDGTSIGSATGAVSVSSVGVPYTASAFYSALDGKSLSGLIRIRAWEINSEGTIISTASAITGGNATINGRLSALVSSNTPNPYNLDSPANINVSWTRPHTAFRGRVTVYVNNTWCFSRYGFGTSANFNPTSYANYVENMINAMGGVSPRDFRIEVQSQFNASTIVDLSGGVLSSNRTNGVIKSFVQKTDLTAFSSFTIGDIINYTLDQKTAGTTVDIEITIGGVSILTRTGVTGTGAKTITPSAGEITALYNAIPNTSSATATMIATTKDGTDTVGTSSRTATATVSGTIMPNFTTVTHSENIADVATKVGAYVQGRSKLNLAMTGATPGTGATIKSYRITFEAKEITTVSGVSNTIVGSGTIPIVARLTDSRDRWIEKTINVTVLAYSSPQLTGFTFIRANSDGTPNPLETYARFEFTASVSSLINGTQKNDLKYKLYTKTRAQSTYTLKADIDPSTITVTISGTQRIYSGYVIETAYDGLIEVIDIFQTTIGNLSIATGTAPITWGKDGVGINKVVEPGRALDVNGDIWESGTKLVDKYTTTAQLNALIALKANTDNRSVNTIPNDYNSKFEIKGLKTNTVIGLTGEGTYSGVLGLRTWADSSGGNAHEFAFANSGNIYHRSGATTAFGSWARLLDTNDDSRFDKAIESSGSASGQYWIKFVDGTLIKWENFNLTIAIATAFGNIYLCAVQTITYNTTVPFIAEPHMMLGSTDGTALDRTSNPLSSTATSTYCKFQLWRATSTASQLWKIGWMAIGRWKT